MNLRVGEGGELYVAPAMAWIALFGLCALADAMLGRWVLLPIFVAGFYGGTIIIALVTYPMPSSWRGWLRRRGLVPGTSSRSAGSGQGRWSSCSCSPRGG